jgi:hypothetical protein
LNIEQLFLLNCCNFSRVSLGEFWASTSEYDIHVFFFSLYYWFIRAIALFCVMYPKRW